MRRGEGTWTDKSASKGTAKTDGREEGEELQAQARASGSEAGESGGTGERPQGHHSGCQGACVVRWELLHWGYTESQGRRRVLSRSPRIRADFESPPWPTHLPATPSLLRRWPLLIHAPASNMGIPGATWTPFSSRRFFPPAL